MELTDHISAVLKEEQELRRFNGRQMAECLKLSKTHYYRLVNKERIISQKKANEIYTLLGRNPEELKAFETKKLSSVITEAKYKSINDIDQINFDPSWYHHILLVLAANSTLDRTVENFSKKMRCEPEVITPAVFDLIEGGFVEIIGDQLIRTSKKLAQKNHNGKANKDLSGHYFINERKKKILDHVSSTGERYPIKNFQPFVYFSLPKSKYDGVCALLRKTMIEIHEYTQTPTDSSKSEYVLSLDLLPVFDD